MSDRPDYRILYTTFADDADVHALSGLAFKALVLLKLSLPVTGLGVIYPSKLCDQVGCSRAELDVILSELEAPKSGRDRGWIVRDRNVIWIVKALAFESGLTAANKNHVKYVRKLVAGVDTRSPVVAEFRDFYPLWFQEDAKPIRKASRTPSTTPSATDAKGIGKPFESHADPSESESESTSTTQATHSEDLDPERAAPPPAAASGIAPPGPVASSASLASPFAALRDLSHDAPTVAEFVRRFYPRASTAAERRTSVATQLLATLNGGASLKGQRVVAYSLARLNAKCREVLDEGVRDPDKAIVVLLTKLADTSDGAAPGAIAAAEVQRERVQSDAERARELVDANAWLEEHPDVETAIHAQLERDGFPAELPPDDVRIIGRRIARESLVLAAYRRRTPDPAALHEAQTGQ